MSRLPLLIDPLAMLLKDEIYIRLTLPDPPPDLKSQIAAVIRTLSAEERTQLAHQATRYVSYFSAVAAAAKEVG